MAIHRRKHIRLRGHDYREPGAYFVTVCTKDRRHDLGRVVDGRVLLKPNGFAVRHAWLDLPNHHVNVTLDAFVIMPDHVHGIIVLGFDLVDEIDRLARSPEAQQAAPLPVRPGSLGTVVRGFKSASTREVNRLRQTPGALFWQRGYWDHVIRDIEERRRVQTYIADNPRRWGMRNHGPKAG
jgi:putative transposase